MEEKQENKSLLQKLANNPLLTLIFGIASILGLGTGFYFYFQSIKEAKPVYAVISDDLISDSKSNSKIKISYDSVMVDNVRLAKIVIWNGGNTYLDSQDFLDSVHIKILPSRDAQILEANISKISRDNLKHSISISKDKSLIQLNILDKEVLEVNDGFQLQIFYASKANFVPEWKVDSRIKGISKGFINGNQEEVFSIYTHRWNTYIITFVIICLIITFTIKTFDRILMTISRIPNKKRPLPILILFVTLIPLIYFSVHLCIQVKVLFYQPLSNMIPEILK